MELPSAIALDMKGKSFPDIGGLSNIEAWVGEFRWPPILVFDIDWASARAVECDVSVGGHELILISNPPESIYARCRG